MKVKILLPIIISMMGMSIAVAQEKGTLAPQYLEQCFASREFITTMEFLRTHKELQVTDKNTRQIADQISQGCSGASKRFIQVTDLLSKAGLDYKSTIETAIKFAKSSDIEAQTFIIIFRHAFVEDQLNLDLHSSIKMALSLSIEFKGDQEKARKDFFQLVQFCVSKDDLDLPIPECAKFAAKITSLGQNYKEQVSKPFIDLFKFIKNPFPAPARSTYEALKLSENIISYGPLAASNFIQAYNYATSKNGLDLDSNEAIDFGKKMASRTLVEQKVEGKNLKTQGEEKSRN